MPPYVVIVYVVIVEVLYVPYVAAPLHSRAGDRRAGARVGRRAGHVVTFPGRPRLGTAEGSTVFAAMYAASASVEYRTAAPSFTHFGPRPTCRRFANVCG